MGMANSETNSYDTIITRQMRSGRATRKREIIHQAPELLDAIARGGVPPQNTFEGREDLARLLRAGLQSGPARPMTDERWAKVCGRVSLARNDSVPVSHEPSCTPEPGAARLRKQNSQEKADAIL